MSSSCITILSVLFWLFVYTFLLPSSLTSYMHSAYLPAHQHMPLAASVHCAYCTWSVHFRERAWLSLAFLAFPLVTMWSELCRPRTPPHMLRSSSDRCTRATLCELHTHHVPPHRTAPMTFSHFSRFPTRHYVERTFLAFPLVTMWSELCRPRTPPHMLPASHSTAHAPIELGPVHPSDPV